jgi:hypothetical protein
MIQDNRAVRQERVGKKPLDTCNRAKFMQTTLSKRTEPWALGRSKCGDWPSEKHLFDTVSTDYNQA